MAVEVVAIIALAIVVALFAWWLFMLIEALRTPTALWTRSGQSQLVYIVLMVFLGAIGTLAYVAIARPRLRREAPAQAVEA